jgi:hypothetical protein
MADQINMSDRIDAVMHPEGTGLGGRRRRSFVAAASDTVELPVHSLPARGIGGLGGLDGLDRPEDLDDLPVLTEIVTIEAAIATIAAPEPDPIDETLLSIIAADLIHSIENQLAIELPTLIEATLLNAQNELRTGVNSTLEMALRDFLARRQQLRLPLNDPNRDK